MFAPLCSRYRFAVCRLCFALCAASCLRADFSFGGPQSQSLRERERERERAVRGIHAQTVFVLGCACVCDEKMSVGQRRGLVRFGHVGPNARFRLVESSALVLVRPACAQRALFCELRLCEMVKLGRESRRCVRNVCGFK